MRKLMTALAALGFLSVADQVSAAKWHWHVEYDGATKICAKSIADTYVLGCNSTATGNQVWRKTGFAQWEPDGTAKGRSITQSMKTGFPWLVGFDNSIWYRTAAGWYSMPSNKCEGGNNVVRKVLGDKSIAVGIYDNVEQAYYVEDGTANNTVRWWNGACWARLPPLPTSTAREIGIFDDHWDNGGHGDGWPWVLGFDNVVHRWNGAAWVFVGNGIAGISSTSAGYRKVLGTNLNTLWTFDQVNNTFVQDTSWTFGTIQELGARYNSGFSTFSVLRSNGEVYRWIYD